MGDDLLGVTPLPSVEYPITVSYCGNCSMPIEKKRQKRGGKGMVKAKKKEDVQKKITVFVAPRGKKRLTVVVGLKTFDIDLKSAAKHFGTKFACGSSVTGDDEIVIQGDIKDDLIDHIPEKWTEIDDDSIEDGGEHKR
ncbi:Density-regulated-like protein [Armadillidium nasatum]|uniref:Density-regulated protein homolog n=1 Tax=Armadillidium nasatum TaxID=96803 RepID=A0A5N5TLH4_9CRUS|nr:Density-regulated-like protein [Armadillidium nasatum]